LKNIRNGSTVSYTLVPENEASVKNGKISVSSPIAKGLLGKTIGDRVNIQVPAGEVSFEIIEIKRDNS
jgi:transcription elongation factor GreA